MLPSLVKCLGVLAAWINPAANRAQNGVVGSEGPVVTGQQMPLGMNGATRSHDSFPAITPAPKFPLVRKQVNSFIGYISDATGCKLLHVSFNYGRKMDQELQ